MKYCCCCTDHIELVVPGHPHGSHGLHHLHPVLPVVSPVHVRLKHYMKIETIHQPASSYICGVEVSIIINVSDATVVLDLLVGRQAHLVEDVEVPLPSILADHTGLLQQEIGNLSASWLASIEENLYILAL